MEAMDRHSSVAMNSADTLAMAIGQMNGVQHSFAYWVFSDSPSFTVPGIPNKLPMSMGSWEETPSSRPNRYHCWRPMTNECCACNHTASSGVRNSHLWM